MFLFLIPLVSILLIGLEFGDMNDQLIIFIPKALISSNHTIVLSAEDVVSVLEGFN